MEETETDDLDEQGQSVSASSPHSWDGSQHGGSRSDGPPPDIRVQRNQAEKARRDRVGNLVKAIGDLVPLVQKYTQNKSGAKKPDKITILRLAASYMRSHQICKVMYDAFADAVNLPLPPEIGQQIEDLIVEDQEGTMGFILDHAGKIVYASSSVEAALGHQELDLLGIDFRKYVIENDHHVITQCLQPDGEPLRALESVASSEDSSSDDTGTSTSLDSPMGEMPGSPSAGPSAGASAGPSVPPILNTYPRKFRVRMQHKVTGREEPQWEEVVGDGKLYVFDAAPVGTPSPHRRRSQDRERTTVFAFYLQLARNQNRSIIPCSVPPSNDEYRTLHAMDGSFMESDHRIAIISGYLPHEVVGVNAFNFMHEADAKWAQVSLKTMLKNQETSGWSVYRLKTKNGEYITLMTMGYMEKNGTSFICINKKISKEEAKTRRLAMMRRVSATQSIVEVSEDTPADTFATERPPSLQSPPSHPMVTHPMRPSVVKRSGKRGVEDHALGDVKRLRYAEGPSNQGLGHQGPSHQSLGLQDPGHQGLGHQGLGHQGLGHQGLGQQGPSQQGLHTEQRIVRRPALVPTLVPTLAPTPDPMAVPRLVPTPAIVSSQAPVVVSALASPPDPLLGVFTPDALDIPGVLGGVSSVSLSGDLGDVLVDEGSPSSSAPAYQDRLVLQDPSFPNAEWGRSDVSLVHAEPAQSLNLYQAVIAPSTVTPLDTQQDLILNTQEDLILHQGTIGDSLEAQDQEARALQQDVKLLPTTQRTLFNNRLTEFQEERSRQQRQLDDLSRQTKLYS